MSLKRKIKEIAIETSTKVTQGFNNQRFNQITSNETNLAEIISSNGVNLTVKMADGSTQEVIANGSRNLGPGEHGVVANGVFM